MWPARVLDVNELMWLGGAGVCIGADESGSGLLRLSVWLCGEHLLCVIRDLPGTLRRSAVLKQPAPAFAHLPTLHSAI